MGGFHAQLWGTGITHGHPPPGVTETHATRAPGTASAARAQLESFRGTGLRNRLREAASEMPLRKEKGCLTMLSSHLTKVRRKTKVNSNEEGVPAGPGTLHSSRLQQHRAQLLSPPRQARPSREVESVNASQYTWVPSDHTAHPQCPGQLHLNRAGGTEHNETGTRTRETVATTAKRRSSKSPGTNLDEH